MKSQAFWWTIIGLLLGGAVAPTVMRWSGEALDPRMYGVLMPLLVQVLLLTVTTVLIMLPVILMSRGKLSRSGAALALVAGILGWSAAIVIMGLEFTVIFGFQGAVGGVLLGGLFSVFMSGSRSIHDSAPSEAEYSQSR